MGVIALMGSGETSPTMVGVHRQLLERYDRPDAIFLDTPFGFQENADVLTTGVIEYFATSLNVDLEAPTFRGEAATDYQRETMLERVRNADYVFAGPGSPTYALEHWTRVGLAVAAKICLERGGTIALASAAAVTAGSKAIPVYEIYKVGAAPHWREGLDLLTGVGIRAVVVPHFNNAEGANHDTRFCFLGARRFDALRAELEVPVLGIDEHTALILDGESRRATVHGKGEVTLLTTTSRETIAAGSAFSFDELPEQTTLPEGPPAAGDDGREQAFGVHLAAGDVAGAVDLLLAADDRSAQQAMIVRLGRLAERGSRPTRSIVAPFVAELLRLRDRARAAEDWAEADRIRDALIAAGVEIRDGETDTGWVLED